METHRIAFYTIIAASLLLAALVWPAAPDTVPIHWNIAGEPDAWADARTGIAILPALIIATGIGLALLSREFGSGDTQTRRATGWFIVLLLAFLLGIQVFAGLTATGYPVPTNFFFPILFSLLYLGTSILLPRLRKPNKLIGIRTPWTMKSEAVWIRTHQKSGRVMQAAAGITLLGSFYPDYLFLFILAPALGALLWLVLVSYREYRTFGEIP
ncbi:MAG: DUF1648 domain-containing protein [Methanocalculus sp. MSAO_Arc1]|uniref:SdpI family protein n=1 Tax=Methanocalculus TaxID=71151 RepID=UPI000FF548CD|nr:MULTISPECIES: SdpI family protein [unclassified Methanocalculus]MCP1662863.1 putative membrane protein [Methanocalculus sp. AMF5]RQD82081.1 MAG: DUF1648 domain-containing protein [Methanocalculus sp. MSAO_Arc1]